MKHLRFIGFICLLVSNSALLIADASKVDERIRRLDARILSLQKELQRETNANKQRLLRAEEARRKNDSKKAEREMKEAFLSADRITAINNELNRLRAEKNELCDQWKAYYRQKTDQLLQKAQIESDRKKRAEVGKTLQALQSNNATLCPGDFQPTSNEWRSIQIETFDGPHQVALKTQLLKDISREIDIDLQKLDSHYQDSVKERQARERAQEFVQEGGLFNNSPTLRSTTAGDPQGPLQGGEIPTSGPVLGTGQEPSEGGSTSSVATSSDWLSKEDFRQFETEYKKRRQQLLTTKEELRKKITEFEEKARVLKIP